MNEVFLSANFLASREIKVFYINIFNYWLSPFVLNFWYTESEYFRHTMTSDKNL